MELHMILITKLTLSIVCIVLNAWLQTLSTYFISFYWLAWVSGAIFGAVNLMWGCMSLREALSPRSLGFLVASTLIYAVGHWIVVRNFHWFAKEGEYLITLKAVAVGTVFLVLLHALLLETPWRRAFLAIPCIYGVWFVFMMVLNKLNPPLSLGLAFTFFTMGNVIFWQVSYLLFMFAPPLKLH